jgi:hypothetical protein
MAISQAIWKWKDKYITIQSLKNDRMTLDHGGSCKDYVVLRSICSGDITICRFSRGDSFADLHYKVRVVLQLEKQVLLRLTYDVPWLNCLEDDALVSDLDNRLCFHFVSRRMLAYLVSEMELRM